MSLHKSKGLTADNVIIVGMNQGILPKKDKDATTHEARQRSIEEQRRLFYVALTRASKSLIISSSLSIPTAYAYSLNMDINQQSDTEVLTGPSVFISELGPHAPKVVDGKIWLNQIK